MMQVQTENIPKALKQSPNFVLWRKEERDKRETKVPYQRNGRYAKSDDPTTWTNYSAAVSALINGHGKYDGIGFCLSEGTPIGIDLDHCRCPAFPGIEIIAPWATEIIKQVDSYTEASPSGKGIRIFAYGGKLPAHGRKKGLPEYGGDNCRKDAVPAFEIYESGRYLTITGNRIAWTPTDVMSRPEAIATVHKRIFSDMATDKGKPEIVRPVANMSVTDTLEKAYRSKNGEKIRALYNGNYLDYPSQSEADLALCSHLAFWFGNDSAQIDSAFRSSGLFRPKWNEKHFSSGQTYGQSVIEKAVSSCKETYQAAAAPSALIIEKPSPPEKPLPFIFRRLSDIQAMPILWLWPGRFARGKVSIVAGHPGLGKSQVVVSMAAIVTTKGLWPVDRVRCESGNVIILSAEDDASDTIRPRLDAAGADVRRVFILDAVTDTNGGRRSFNLAADLGRLGLMIEEIGGAALIIIDPISAYLGGIDSHKNADIRALLAPLAELAAKHEVAIIGVSHLNKCGGGEALTRIMGSLAFVAAARAAYLIVKDPDDAKRRLFLPVKNNIGNDSTGLAFTIESKKLSGGIETSSVLWESDPVTVTADEAMQPQVDTEERSALDDTKEFLANILAEGQLTSKQIRADAEGAGHSWRTIQRARKLMRIEVRKDGMKGPWMWQLPPKNAKDPEECQANNVAVFGNVGSLRQTEEPILSYAEEDFPNMESQL